MSLRDALGGIKEAQGESQQIDVEERADKPKQPSRRKQETGRATGKSASPDYERFTVYVRKDTKKAAVRKWEDTGKGGDMSDLVQSLLIKYLVT